MKTSISSTPLRNYTKNIGNSKLEIKNSLMIERTTCVIKQRFSDHRKQSEKKKDIKEKYH